ncbi:MAG: arabinofuranosidase catalytic domain-containing protein, partial [Polyangia bacterium]
MQLPFRLSVIVALATTLIGPLGCAPSRSPSSASGGADSGGSSGVGGGFGGSQGSGGSSSSGGTSGSGGLLAGGVTGSSATGAAGSSGGGPSSGGSTGAGSGGAASGGHLVSAGGIMGGATGTGSGGITGAGGSGTATSAGAGGTAGSSGTGAQGPCDIYQSGSPATPCVAAHSMVRALYASYSGNLYQVQRASDKTTKDIPLLAPGGFVDSSVQDTFCAGTTCTISIIYDQSPQKNDLPVSPPVHWLANGGTAVNATLGKASVGGHTVYGIYVTPDVGNTYRNNKATGLAKDDDPESMYMVADGTHYNGRCCFDYGNAETDGNDDGNATMECIEWGNMTT